MFKTTVRLILLLIALTVVVISCKDEPHNNNQPEGQLAIIKEEVLLAETTEEVAFMVVDANPNVHKKNVEYFGAMYDILRTGVFPMQEQLPLQVLRKDLSSYDEFVVKAQWLVNGDTETLPGKISIQLDPKNPLRGHACDRQTSWRIKSLEQLPSIVTVTARARGDFITGLASLRIYGER